MLDHANEIDEVIEGKLAKILAVSDDDVTIHIQLEGGPTARATASEAVDFAPGDIVLISGSTWEHAPASLWREDRFVGVVRTILDDHQVLLETNRGLELVSAEIDVARNNTVEYNSSSGIRRVISERPIRHRELGGDDDDPASQYRVDTGSSGPSFADFGGYDHVLARARELIETQLDRKERLQRIGARPIKGIMFTGPPGTGKTLLARIIARESNADFFLISGPTIVSKWVGDSEETLRRIFDAASKSPKAIIFFDEIDSLAESRKDDSNESSKRMVAQLLTLMDGFDQSEGNVVVIAATNRVDAVDDALQRPGRFDWEIEFGMPTAVDRYQILEVGKKNLAISGELPIRKIAEQTEGWSAARLSSLWTEAALLSAGDERDFICDEDLAEAFERVSARPVREVAREVTDGN